MPTVLLADGDRDLREIFAEMLSAHGVQVETAGDGLECVTRLRHRAPDVLILDWELLWGGSDGVLAWLRGEETRYGIPVILTSTAGLTPPVELPVVEFLPKPFAFASLLRSVRAAMQLEHGRRPHRLDLRAIGS